MDDFPPILYIKWRNLILFESRCNKTNDFCGTNFLILSSFGKPAIDCASLKNYSVYPKIFPKSYHDLMKVSKKIRQQKSQWCIKLSELQDCEELRKITDTLNQQFSNCHYRIFGATPIEKKRRVRDDEGLSSPFL